MSAEKNAAFGEGCDARLAGLEPNACPYESADPRYWAWREGWNDVDQHWGVQAARPVATLPPIGRERFFLQESS